MAPWWLIGFVVLMLAVLPWLMWRLYRWARNMPKGAYLFMAFFPLISLFPIPTESFKQLDEAKQEQRKNKATPDGGDDDDSDQEPGSRPPCNTDKKYQ